MGGSPKNTLKTDLKADSKLVATGKKDEKTEKDNKPKVDETITKDVKKETITKPAVGSKKK